MENIETLMMDKRKDKKENIHGMEVIMKTALLLLGMQNDYFQ